MTRPSARLIGAGIAGILMLIMTANLFQALIGAGLFYLFYPEGEKRQPAVRVDGQVWARSIQAEIEIEEAKKLVCEMIDRGLAFLDDLPESTSATTSKQADFIQSLIMTRMQLSDELARWANEVWANSSSNICDRWGLDAYKLALQRVTEKEESLKALVRASTEEVSE